MRRRRTVTDLPPGTLVAGVDEAGRGPLAGPVVVAAVILDPARPVRGLDDSKYLSEERRDVLEPRIRERALAFAVIEVSVADIDRLNIFQATMHGMATALAALSQLPGMALIDGNRLPRQLCCPARAVIGGDASEPAISAASILAKVARDRLMTQLDAAHPGYGFARHKGYPTPEHLECLSRLGPCAHHRRSFAPVRALLAPQLF
jgi:ribonuclease HII